MKTRYAIILLLLFSCSDKTVTADIKPESAEYLSRMNKLMYSDIKSSLYITVVNTDCLEYVATAVNQFNISVDFTNKLIDNSAQEQAIKYKTDSIIKFEPSAKLSEIIDSRPLSVFLKRSIYCFNKYYNVLKPKLESIEGVSLDTVYFYATKQAKDEIGTIYEKFQKRLNHKMTLLDGLSFIQEWTNEILYLKYKELTKLKYKATRFCSQATLRSKVIENDSLKVYLNFSYTDSTNSCFVRYSDRNIFLEDTKDREGHSISGLMVPFKTDTIYGTIMCYRYDEIVWSPWKVRVK